MLFFCDSFDIVRPMNDTKQITQLQRIMAKFEGCRPMARALKKPVSSVSRWTDYVPGKYVTDVMTAAILNGVPVTFEDFFDKTRIEAAYKERRKIEAEIEHLRHAQPTRVETAAE